MMDAEQSPVDLARVERPVPPHDDRREADEAVEERNELGHPGHFDNAGAPQPDRSADQHRDHEQRQSNRRLRLPPQLLHREPDRRGNRDDHAADTEQHTAAGCLVLAEPVQTQDEQERSDEIRGPRDGCRN